jgi:hypothetical protein
MKIEKIKVRVVDNQKLEDYLRISLPKNQKLHLDSFAVFEDQFCIDPDCCFWEIENEHINDKIQPVIKIYCRIQKYKSDGSSSLRMDDYDFIKTISLDDYVKLSKEVKLIDFIRFNYNPRIISNQKLFIKHIKKSAIAT